MTNGEPSSRSWEAAVHSIRNEPAQSVLVQTAYYDDPLEMSAERYRQSEEWEAIRGWIGDNRGTALDIGAGRGIASYALARDGFEVTALEPDESSLVGAGAIRSLASSTGLRIKVVTDVSEHLPLPSGSFDLVFGRAVLHHVMDLSAAARECFRVLRPGGLFIAVREHVISRKKDLPEFLQAHPLQKFYGGENALLLSEYTEALAAAGFTLRASLRPLESPINYFPQTRHSLREEILRRVGIVPGVQPLLRPILSRETVFSKVLWFLSRVDARPGRLYSFVCQRPLEN